MTAAGLPGDGRAGCAATTRAVHDVLAHGLRGDLAHSAVGIELGINLQSGVTADVADGASPGAVLAALRSACGHEPVAYARILELLVLAELDQLQVLADLPPSDLSPIAADLPPVPRRSTRRRR